jgi:PKD repeat protein
MTLVSRFPRLLAAVLLISVLALFLGASGAAQARTADPITVTPLGESALVLTCEAGRLLVDGGQTSPAIADCAGAASLDIIATTADGALTDVVIAGDIDIFGPVTIVGSMVRVEGNLTATSVIITANAGFKLADGASILTTGGPIVIDGAGVGVVLEAGSLLDAAGGQVVIRSNRIVLDGIVTSAGGDVTATAGASDFLLVNGTIDVSGTTPGATGGSVLLTRGTVKLTTREDGRSALINASGSAGGGTILIGGAARGEGDTPTASAVIIDAGAAVHADAIDIGDGGTIVIWADKLTSYDGSITVRGGAASGDGGSVEISSKISLQQAGSVDASAPNGLDGDILIDPLYYMVLPNIIIGVTEIDDLDHILIKSGLIVDAVTFVGQYFCELFGGGCLPQNPQVGDLDVRYGSQNTIVGMLSLASKHGPLKNVLKKYKPLITALKIRTAASIVRTATLEAYQGDVSIQSIFGIGMFHGLLDPLNTDDGLNFANQTVGESVLFETMFNVQSHGDISVGGGELTLRAGAPLNLGVIEDIIIGFLPLGTTIATATDMEDFLQNMNFSLHDLDVPGMVRGILFSSLIEPNQGQDAVAFVNLLCNFECIPAVVGQSADIVLNPIANFNLIDDVITGLGAQVPQWFSSIADEVQAYLDALPLASPGDAIDAVLGGWTIPGIPGGTTEVAALCNLGLGTWVGNSCYTIAPTAEIDWGHSHTRVHWCSIIIQSSSHGGCGNDILGNPIPHSHDTSHQLCLATHSGGRCYTPATSGTAGDITPATTLCNLGTGFWVDGDCWTTPPIPVTGICQIDPSLGIPCSTQSLIDDWFTPFLELSVEAALSLATGSGLDNFENMGGLPDFIGIPHFSVQNQVPTIIYVEKVTNPKGIVNLINTGTGGVYFSDTVRAKEITIDARGNVANFRFASSQFDISSFDLTTNPGGPGNGLLRTASLTIDAGGEVGSTLVPIELKSSTPLSLKLTKSGEGEVDLLGRDSLTLTPTSFISSPDGFGPSIGAQDDLTIPAGVVITANPSERSELWIDVDKADAAGGVLTFLGTATGGGLDLQGNGQDDTFTIARSISADLPVSVYGRGGFDTLNVGSSGPAVTHGTTPRLHVVGQSSITLSSIERVNGVAPILNPIGDVTLTEGESLNIPFTITDWGASNWELTLTDLSNNATLVQQTFSGAANGAGPFPLTGSYGYVFADQAELDLELCVVDTGDSGQVCEIFHVSVSNAAPTVIAGANQNVDEGELVALDPSTFNDLGTLDTHTATVDWGDGSPVASGVVTENPFGPPGSVLGANGTVASNHVYAEDGPYTVTVTVTDDEGLFASSTLDVSVDNVAPTVEAGPSQTGSEGSVVSLTAATFNDLGTLDTHTATIDWGDGSPLAAGLVTETPFGPPGSTAGANGTVAGSHVYADNGSYTVTITVTDDDGATGWDSLPMVIANVAPTIDAGADQASAEGSVVSLAPASFSDAGTLDTHTATIDWGDGSPLDTGAVIETPAGPPGSTAGADGTIAGSHVYADNGTYTVTVTVVDDDLAPASDTLQVVVANVAPTLDAGADQASAEGSVVSLDPSTFNDLGTLDTHTATIDWGDGSPVATGVVSETPTGPAGSTAGADGSIAGSHVYADNGTYTVTVTVVDDDLAPTSDTLVIVVSNVTPTLDAGAGQTAVEGDTVSLEPATFNDLGTLDSHVGTIDWGDGTAIDTGAVSETPTGPPGSTAGADGTIAGSHVYAENGTYTVTVTVTDDENATATGSFVVAITNAAPTVDAGADQASDEGSVVSLASATFNDAGTLDTHTATVDWGDGTPVDSGAVSESPFGPPGSTAGADGTVAAAHTYADDGVYTVIITVTDDEGATGADTLLVTVGTVAPSITPSGVPEVILFRPLDIASAFSDPGFDCPACGTLEDFSATADWGDGAVEPLAVSETAGAVGVLTTGMVTGTHTYTWIGTYPVLVTLTDDDGGTASFTFDVKVLGGRELIAEAMRVIAPFDDGTKATDDIEKALKELEDAIDWDLWLDEVHPEPKHGHKIFSEQKKAIK